MTPTILEDLVGFLLLRHSEIHVLFELNSVFWCDFHAQVHQTIVADRRRETTSDTVARVAG